MSGTFDRDLQRVCEPFERDHARLRAELMASLPGETPEAQRFGADVRWRLGTGLSPMKRRILRIGIPAAVAAAVLLAVGLRPQHGRKGGAGQGSGYVYAMSDVPGLLKKAKTMHMKYSAYERDPSRPDKEPVKSEGELWFDFENGRSVKRQSASPECSNTASIGDLVTVCDVQYMMEEYTSMKRGRKECTKGVRFKKLTRFQSMFETRRGDSFLRIFGNVDQIAAFKLAGREVRDGRVFDIWETTIDSGSGVGTARVWLAPATGAIGRVQLSRKFPADAPDWSSMTDFERVELDVPVSDELFSTEPRPGFELENTKQTAPVSVLGGGSLDDVAPYALHYHIAFVLPGGSVLLGWSVWDQKSPDQQAVFKDLVPGGDLPQLPARVVGLAPLPLEKDRKYVGRHLSHTRINGHCIEWSLYVPKHTPSPGEGRLSFNCQVQYNADKDKFGCWFEGLNPDLDIESSEDFDTWIRGAMADMSDSRVVPESITYEYVMQLSRQIRESLGGP